MTSDAITATPEYEAFHVFAAKLALRDGVYREQAAAKIAALALLGKLSAVGIKLADPEDENEVPSDEHQPIPADDWADFQPRDWRNEIIRVRVGDQFRKLALWRDIRIAVAEPASEPRTEPALASQLTAARQWLIELRQAGEPKPGCNAAGLAAVLNERFGLTKHQVEQVAREAREKAPNPNWDTPGRPSKTFPKPS